MNLIYTPPPWKHWLFPLLAICFSSSIEAQENVSNTRPTLDVIPDYTTRFSPDLHFIELSGITAGDEISQEVSITVSTEDEDLIESINADLVDNGKAYISYRLKEGAAGTATVNVTVSDNGETPATVTRTFHIICEALNRDVPVTTPVNTGTQLRAFPNPAKLSTRLYFSTPHDEQQLSVDVYTLTGTKVTQLYTGRTKARQPYYVDVNSSMLATGVYIVRLKGDSHSSNLRLVMAK